MILQGATSLNTSPGPLCETEPDRRGRYVSAASPNLRGSNGDPGWRGSLQGRRGIEALERPIRCAQMLQAVSPYERGRHAISNNRNAEIANAGAQLARAQARGRCMSSAPLAWPSRRARPHPRAAGSSRSLAECTNRRRVQSSTKPAAHISHASHIPPTTQPRSPPALSLPGYPSDSAMPGVARSSASISALHSASSPTCFLSSLRAYFSASPRT
jgi:hypothetical protein